MMIVMVKIVMILMIVMMVTMTIPMFSILFYDYDDDKNLFNDVVRQLVL